jgi:hypothetical protein
MVSGKRSAYKSRNGRRAYGQGPPKTPAEQLSELQHALPYVLAAPDADRIDLLTQADQLTRNVLFMRRVTDLTKRHVYSRVLAALVLDYWSSLDGPGNPFSLELALAEISASVDDINNLLAAG